MKKIVFLLMLVGLLSMTLTVIGQDEDLPTFDDLEAGVWNQIIPGGETVCLYDTEYSFFVRPADPPTDNLMVYFQGGGACWDGFTCGAIGQFASVYEITDDHMDFYTEGYFDFDNEANPVADYNIVFAPYCSGDVHGGDSVVTFDVPAEQLGVDFDEITVNFNGFNNSRAVMDWTFENFAEPEEVMVSGCSAGGYGATYNAPYIMDNYSDVQVVHVADAATGVTPTAWQGYETWNFLENLPEFVPGLAEATLDTYNNNLSTTSMAAAFPENTFAQYNAFLDNVQIGFYGLLIGTPVSEENFAEVAEEWTTGLLTNLATIEGTVDNFSSYTVGGLSHCVVNRPEFYTYEIEGMTVSEWVAGLLEHNTENDLSCDPASGECLAEPVTEE